MIDHVLEDWTPEVIRLVLEGKDPYRAPMKFSGWQTPAQVNRAGYIWDGIAYCAERTGIPVNELLGPRQDAHTANARGAAINWLLKNYNCTVSHIARAFDRDHATVLHWKRNHHEKLRHPNRVYRTYWEAVSKV